MSIVARRGARPIAVRILALVIGAVVAATAVLFFVTYNGPPPMEPPRPLFAIADALRGAPASFHLQRHPFARDRPLIVTRADAPPAPRWRESTDAATAARIAALMQVPTSRVVANTELRPRQGGRELFGRFTVAWRTPAGWRIVRNASAPAFTRWHANTLGAMALAIALLSLPAWALARAISRPLRHLARAATKAQAGAARPDFPLDGPTEVRALTAAVSAMHDRLAGHAEARTAMLGAIAHDLGTPLSRLAFYVEQLPDAARERASADIDEMRAMIADTLRFARDESAGDAPVRLDLGSLIDSLVEDMAIAGTPVTAEPGERAVVRGDAGALRRLFANLIDNAVRYGGEAAVAWHVEAEGVQVSIADRGPGIDPAQAERLFEPFVRGEASRNRATGGTGLGLAIVRAITARHGGRVTLDNRRGRAGAVATVMLPLAR